MGVDRAGIAGAVGHDKDPLAIGAHDVVAADRRREGAVIRRGETIGGETDADAGRGDRVIRVNKVVVDRCRHIRRAERG